jgi:hypothetical protein
VPAEFQGAVMGDLNKRKGLILDSSQEAEDAVIEAHVPLNNMFGYSTVLRSATQGKGEPRGARLLRAQGLCGYAAAPGGGSPASPAQRSPDA